ncbi:MAG: hypothetical protein H6667_18490 [Ardenticatenaceae bacterium]|nr:hypothetical protein [Ardenticatenaceae bacterium]MCB9445735.1 hypothetical protein [Ardenticatenaceae bacterium]
MLFWENENPANGTVHHLTVICYHIQHPSLYSPEGLNYAKQLLAAFLVEKLSPDEIRKRSRAQVDSSQRTWRIKGTPDHHSDHPHSITWTITAVDVIASGSKNYCANVERWARSIHKALETAPEP